MHAICISAWLVSRLHRVASVAVEGIKKTRYAVEERACAWVEGHVIERSYGEDDARVACGLLVELWQEGIKLSHQ